MKKRLRLKKKVLYIGIVSIVLIVGGIILGVKVYNDYQYKKTYEYKLISHGYELEDAKEIVSFYNNSQDIEHILEIPKDNIILDLIKEKYYINNNLDRYLAYYSDNKDTSFSDIVAIVNVNRDYEDYEYDIESDISLGSALIVNKYYVLNSSYEPDSLTKISLRYSYDGNYITEEANDAYVDMWNAAKNDNLTLIVNSSYRSYESQERVYNNIKNSSGAKEADKVAARPGHSEHQTGLAIDIFELSNQSTSTFKDSSAYTWLLENAYKYGFILRYPEDKEYLTGYSFEAWHWRYVGVDIATIMHEEDITFDEYYAYYIEK